MKHPDNCKKTSNLLMLIILSRVQENSEGVRVRVQGGWIKGSVPGTKTVHTISVCVYVEAK